MDAAGKAVALDALARKIIVPYTVIASVLVLLAVWVWRSGLPEMEEPPEEEAAPGEKTTKTSVSGFPHLLLGVFTLFVYVGVEVIAGTTIIQYGTYQHIPMSAARFFTSFTLSGMLAGYLVGIVCIPRYFSQHTALKGCALFGTACVLLALYTHGLASVIFIALLGLANSLMYLSIWPLAIDGLGKFTKTASSLLVMAISGGALLPLAYGWLADHFNVQQAYWVLFPVMPSSAIMPRQATGWAERSSCKKRYL